MKGHRKRIHKKMAPGVSKVSAADKTSKNGVRN